MANMQSKNHYLAIRTYRFYDELGMGNIKAQK
jgi:hypothetical protein